MCDVYTRVHHRDDDRQNSILTTSQRKFLKSNIKSGATTKRKRIRERIDQGLHDFRILADELEERDRNEVFNMPLGAEESQELQVDVQATVEFLYTGMGGEAGFRKPLEKGVSRGESTLANATLPLEVDVQFRTEQVKKNRDAHEIVDLIESQEWDKLHASDLFDFIKWAMSARILDFDSIRDRIDSAELAAEMKKEKIKSEAELDVAMREFEESGDRE